VKTSLTQGYKNVDVMKMNLTQFERVKSELKQRFYEQKNHSGILVNIENIFRMKPVGITLSNQQNVFFPMHFGPWVDL
jgi:hypothetical protein